LIVALAGIIIEVVIAWSRGVVEEEEEGNDGQADDDIQ
jgi:hypothetical protein